MAASLVEHLAPYGAPPERIVELRGPAVPAQVRYADLRGTLLRDLLAPDGVVELHDGPLAYVVDATSDTPSEETVGRLCRLLSCRGEAPYLAVVEPGRLRVYEITRRRRRRPEVRLTVEEGAAAATTSFHLLHSQPPVSGSAGPAIQQQLFKLFTDAVAGLMPHGADPRATDAHSDAISLAGRAFFTRFLVDRGALGENRLGESELRVICPGATSPEDLFSGSRRARATCEWLDRTFNGDFLPLTDNAFRELDDDAFWHLANIMNRTPSGQRSFSWASVNFSYVPVEVLSQVYEWSAEKWDLSLKKIQSMYFTPLRIARYMVREVFAGLEARGPVSPHEARVLDPAVGGGVFLVAAFREIFAARWRHLGRVPNTAEIRSILAQQLRGFDIHEPALRLAALGLYLTAIELDQEPRPIEKLGFEPLRDRVLFHVRTAGEPATSLTPGSLSHLDDPTHHGYDVVIGNPPWTALSDKRNEDAARAKYVHAKMIEAIRPVVEQRLGAERAGTFEVGDLVPDLPFFWAAMRWARAGGWISFALHGRILFKQTDVGQGSRRDLLEAVEVTGILNGADLRETGVWPKVKAPFCLIFARNEKPRPQGAFHFVTPYRESSLNRQGRLRIDARDAHPVQVALAVSEPALHKVLYRGTILDLTILQKIKQREALTPFGEYWYAQCGRKGRQGYQRAQRTRSAAHLQGYPNLDRPTNDALIDPAKLGVFTEEKLQWPRRPEIYVGPLLLVRQTELDVMGNLRAHAFLPTPADPASALEERDDDLADKLAYNEFYYGYSAAEHPGGEFLIRYFVVMFNSNLFLWHALITSGKFGVERPYFQKIDVDTFPVVPAAEIRHLADDFERVSSRLFQGEDCQADIDRLAARVYGLDSFDLEVIADTLSVNLPAAVENAERQPTPAEIRTYRERVRWELTPFVDAGVLAVDYRECGPWGVLAIEPTETHSPHRENDLEQVLLQAADLGASQVVVREAGRLMVAVLRRNRYWTPSRARLLAIEILEEHLDDLLDQQSSTH